jgi:hypothetical protein
MSKPERDNSYVERRRKDLAGLRGVLFEERFGGYFYLRGQLLLSVEDEKELAPELRRRGGRKDREINRRFEKSGLNVRRWVFPDNVSIPETVAELRKYGARRLGPNHVLGSDPRTSWGGGGAPRMAVALKPVWGKPPSEQASIAVLDTGVADDTAKRHPELFAVLTDVTGDHDRRDDDGDGLLDSGAGHGTFILGILHRLLPDLRLDVEAVLGTHGYGDDASMALGIAETNAGVRNLSFGTYTHDNTEPPAIAAAIESAGPDVVFVAAAGNHSRTEPYWPAAFPQVVAVAALDTRDGDPVPAGFTNRGEWVDACAPGVDLHSYYVGGVWPGDGEPDIEFDGWARWDGTSFAAPQVAAGITALAAERNLTPRAAADELLAGLPPLPGAPDLGVVYLPPTDLVFRP